MNEQEKLNILFVTGECLPFCANGGVADMCFALTKYLNRKEELDVRVIMPLYSNIPEQYRNKFRKLGEKTIELAWRREYAGVFEYKMNGIIYYFIDNERYFKRDRLFGYEDDVERFSFFSKAVLDVFPIMGFFPDIIHAHDWQSSMTCTFLKILQWQNPKYEHIKTVLNIHNLIYQGVHDFKIVTDLLGVEDKFAYLFDYYAQANILKAGILCSDQIVAVSKTYKEEILTTEKGNGLQNVLEQCRHKLSGITNGIDYEYYNPKTDPAIFENYDESTLSKREINKIKLQEEFGLDVDKTKPMFCFIGYMASYQGLDLLTQILDKYLEKGIQLVGIGGGVKEYEDYMKSLNEKYPRQVKINFGYSTQIAKKIYAASDFLLNVSSTEPCGLCPMIANKYGTLPIVYYTGGIKENVTDFKTEDGNGYVLKNYDANSLGDLIDRALQDFANGEKMTRYRLSGMAQNFDVQLCAEAFYKLYKEI